MNEPAPRNAMHAAIYRQVRAYLPPHAQQLPTHANLRNDAGLDSLDLVELVIRLENHYGIRIPDPELEHLHTLADVVRCIARHRRLARRVGPIVFSLN